MPKRTVILGGAGLIGTHLCLRLLREGYEVFCVDVRNICAHYNRLYNQPLEEQPMLFAHQRLYESDRLFPMLLALRNVAGRERVYRDMIAGIARLIEDYPQADPALCGFPKDWERLLN